MSNFRQEQQGFEHMAGCLVGCEQILFDCVRESPLDRCNQSYTNCEDACEREAANSRGSE